MTRCYCTVLLASILILNCSAQPTDKFIPKGKKARERLETAEPGTYLKPAASSFLDAYTRARKGKTEIKAPSEGFIKFFSRRQKEVRDTLICCDSCSVPVRVYYPSRKSMEGNSPVILLFHGGGFIYGSVDEYHMLASRIAWQSDMVLVSVEYRLAPEYPFPYGVKDCYAAYKWLRRSGSGLGIDSTRICLMGDSAGGNLAAVVTLMCKDQGEPQPWRQVLVYPATSLMEEPSSSMRYFALEADRDYLLNEAFMRKVIAAYLGEKGDACDPYASPLVASIDASLPPALIITAECDPLRDGGRAYARKLSEAGVDVSYYEYSGMIHGFVSMHAFFKEGKDAIKMLSEYLKEK